MQDFKQSKVKQEIMMWYISLALLYQKHFVQLTFHQGEDLCGDHQGEVCGARRARGDEDHWGRGGNLDCGGRRAAQACEGSSASDFNIKCFPNSNLARQKL